MKKITLILAATMLGFSSFAQGQKDAKTLLGYERYSSAKTALASASSAEDKYHLGLAEIGLGNIDAARQIFTSIGDNEYGKAGLARISYLEGDYTTANNLLNQMVDKAKRRDYHVYKLAADAITYTSGGDINKAIEWYKKSMEKTRDAATLVALGDAYLKLNTSIGNGEALTAFQEAVTLDPKNSLAHSRQGYLLYAGRQYEAALSHYNEAQAADPQNPLPYRDLANAYYFTNNFQLSKTNIEKYLQLSDASVEDLYHYTNVLYLTQDYAGALSKIDEVMAKVDNPLPYLYRIKGYSLMETGKPQEAKTNLEKYFSLEKDQSKYLYSDYFYLGKINASLAKDDTTKRVAYLAAANENFAKALPLRDTTKDLREQIETIAKTFEDAEDYASAGRWYGEGVKLLGNEVSSYDYFNYGYWTYFGRDFEKAKNIFAEMEQKFPGAEDKIYATYWQGLASSQIDREGKTGIGVPHFEQWLAIPLTGEMARTNDQLKTAYQYMAFYYYNADKKADAVKYSNLLLGVDPSNQVATQIIEYFNAKK